MARLVIGPWGRNIQFGVRMGDQFLGVGSVSKTVTQITDLPNHPGNGITLNALTDL
jgi:hypothetical protein